MVEHRLPNLALNVGIFQSSYFFLPLGTQGEASLSGLERIADPFHDRSLLRRHRLHVDVCHL